jgi:xanthine dehydrogenase YagS FAD-binding subunit
MQPFEYATPSSIEEAAGLLSAPWGETEVLAGGTDLVTALKQGVTHPKRVVSLRNVSGLRGIEASSSAVRIGAMTTMAELMENSDVQLHYPSIVAAAEGIGARQIQAIGTVGGDLCQRPRCWYFRNGQGLFGTENGEPLIANGDNRYHAIFGNGGDAKFVSASSLGPVLIANRATIEVASAEGTRKIAAEDFFKTPQSESDRETALAADEIVTTIEVPILHLRDGTYEVRHRSGLDWPLVTATAAFHHEGGVATDVRVALGHVAPVPWVASAAAAGLEGKAVTEESAAQAGEAAAQGATPLSMNGYKVQLVKTAVKRAILAAAGV